MARKPLTEAERKRRTQERNRKYWAEHREEIAAKRKAKREKTKAEKEAMENLFQEQAKAFISSVEADEDVQSALKAILEGENPREVLTAYAKRKAEGENQSE